MDPRRPLPPNFDDSVDVSVQGLPVVEQQPIFEVSPINGQLYNGPSINADINKLNPSFQQAQVCIFNLYEFFQTCYII